MRRKEILSGVRQVIEAIDKSEIFNILKKIVETPETEKSSMAASLQALEAFRTYTIEADKFNDAAKIVNNLMGLELLTAVTTWQRMAASRRSGFTYKLFETVSFAKDYLPRVVKLLQQEPFEDGKANTATRFKGMKVLTVNIFEPENVISSPVRLANVLESIDHFYTACAMMNGVSPSTLSVIACDSGSDKSFDFLGIASVMDCVERLIRTIFDRVFFYREFQFEERLDLVAKALPIVQQIKKMEEHKEIDPEMAHILRRNVLDGTNKFLQSGATINAIEDKSEYNSRALLSPIQKLLVPASQDEKEREQTAPSSQEEQEKASSSAATSPQAAIDAGITKTSSEEGLDFNNLTKEERERLIELLIKSRGGSSELSETLEPSDASMSENEAEDEYPDGESQM